MTALHLPAALFTWDGFGFHDRCHEKDYTPFRDGLQGVFTKENLPGRQYREGDAALTV